MRLKALFATLSLATTLATSAMACPGHYGPYGHWLSGYYGPCRGYSVAPLPSYGYAPYAGWVYVPNHGWHSPYGHAYWRPGYGWNRY